MLHDPRDVAVDGGPHNLVRLYGQIGGRRVSIMIDDKATHNFLNYTLVKRLKLPQSKSNHQYVVHLARLVMTVTFGIPL